MSCYVIKEMDNGQRASIQFGMHFDTWESTQVPRDGISYATFVLPIIHMHLKLDGRTLDIVYSSKETAQKMSKIIMRHGGFRVDWLKRKRKIFSIRERNKTNSCIHAFSFLLAKQREPQPNFYYP